MPGAFSVGDWRVDPSLHSISGAAGEVRLEPKVMQVLVGLAEHAGQVVSKERLLQTVWADTFVGDEVLARAISELRRVLGDDSKAPRFIQTIPKGGYRLIAPVRFDSRPNQAGQSRWMPRPLSEARPRRGHGGCCGVPSALQSSPRSPLRWPPDSSRRQRRRRRLPGPFHSPPTRAWNGRPRSLPTALVWRFYRARPERTSPASSSN